MTALVANTFNWFGGFADWAVRLNEMRIRRKEIKRTMRELESCTDRELADMGIHRSEIYSIAIGHHDRCRTNENANLKGWV